MTDARIRKRLEELLNAADVPKDYQGEAVGLIERLEAVLLHYKVLREYQTKMRTQEGNRMIK